MITQLIIFLSFCVFHFCLALAGSMLESQIVSEDEYSSPLTNEEYVKSYFQDIEKLGILKRKMCALLKSYVIKIII